MARTGYNGQVLLRNIKLVVQVVRNNLILLGHHTLDRRDNNLAAHGTAYLVERLTDIGRRDGQDEHI